jgi:hypothetical protein
MLPITLRRCPDTCETCRFWQADEDSEDNVLGECLLRAPEFNPVAAGRHDPGSLAGLPWQPWPLTESRHWCASWRIAQRCA